MSVYWGSAGVGFNDDDAVRDVHTLSCAIWQSPDPADGCDCGASEDLEVAS